MHVNFIALLLFLGRQLSDGLMKQRGSRGRAFWAALILILVIVVRILARFEGMLLVEDNVTYWFRSSVAFRVSPILNDRNDKAYEIGFGG